MVVAVLALTASCTDVELPEALREQATTTATESPQPTQNPESEETRTGDDELCLSSLRPAGDELESPVAPDSYMADIQERGVLRVGVDVGTPQFSSISPQTGEPVGFDVDVASEVADQLDVEIDLVGMTTDERIGALLAGRVDMVVHNFTITCERKEEIAFSTEYFRAQQVILVPRGNRARSLRQLKGQRVCATEGSTVMDHIEQMPPRDRPLPVKVRQRADCLMLLQQGQVDALATDDAILAGIAAQDPNLVLRDEVFSEEPYGIGLPQGHDDWVRYVNAVLEDIRDNQWQTLYDTWLGDFLCTDSDPPDPDPCTDPDPPEPVYED